MTTMMAWPRLTEDERWQPETFGAIPEPAQLLDRGFMPWGLRWPAMRSGDFASASGPLCDLQLGWAHPRLARFFADWPRFLDPHQLPAFEAALGQALGHHGWRDEPFALLGPDGEALRPGLGLERSLFRPLGLLSEAVQLNLYDPTGQIWIAQRALTKAIDPGLWDAAVAGGLRLGESPKPALVREAWEEAGLPAGLAEQAEYRGQVRICRQLVDGLQQERVWVYELHLKDSWQPSPQDGEVSAVRLARGAEIMQLWERGAFNHEAAVATLCWSHDLL